MDELIRLCSALESHSWEEDKFNHEVSVASISRVTREQSQFCSGGVNHVRGYIDPTIVSVNYTLSCNSLKPLRIRVVAIDSFDGVFRFGRGFFLFLFLHWPTTKSRS